MTSTLNRGSKRVPPATAPAPDCLAGLSFIFMGESSSFSREDAIDMVKCFCRWVHSSICTSRMVGQQCSRNDYVVLGDNAGPSKLAAFRKHNLKTSSEGDFLYINATRNGPDNGKGFSEKRYEEGGEGDPRKRKRDGGA